MTTKPARTILSPLAAPASRAGGPSLPSGDEPQPAAMKERNCAAMSFIIAARFSFLIGTFDDASIRCHSFFMRLLYTIVLDREEDGRHIASVPGVPGCHAYGRTRRQAISRAQRALEFYVEMELRNGRRPPKQAPAAVAVEVNV